MYMYTAEQLSEATDKQKQTLFQNLARLHDAAIFHSVLEPGTELSVYAAESQKAYLLTIKHDEVNAFDQSGSFYKELVVTEDNKLEYIVESELGQVQMLANVAMSHDVEAYEETMELLADKRVNPAHATIKAYSPEMASLVGRFSIVGQLEIAEYIGYTDQLIDRHLPS